MSIGYKEWLGVCNHLEAGSTSLLLRKGGIHEGREGFSFMHDRFFLYPTAFHDDDSSLRESPPETGATAAHEQRGVTIRVFAVAQWARLVRDKAAIDALAPFHPLAAEVIDQRYSYSEKLEGDCLSVAFVRVHRLATPWTFPFEKRFGGCRSWIDLPEPPADWEAALTPVVDDATQAEREAAIRQIIG